MCVSVGVVLLNVLVFDWFSAVSVFVLIHSSIFCCSCVFQLFQHMTLITVTSWTRFCCCTASSSLPSSCASE